MATIRPTTGIKAPKAAMYGVGLISGVIAPPKDLIGAGALLSKGPVVSSNGLLQVEPSMFEPNIIEAQIPINEQFRTIDSRNDSSGGVSYQYYNSRLKLYWENLKGDYTGTSGGVDVKQGGSPFATGSVLSGVEYKTFDVTTLVQRGLTNGNPGFFMQMTGVNGPSVTWAGRLSANPPLLSVTTEQGTYNCPCILSVGIVAESVSSLPLIGTTQFQVSTTRNGIVQFDLSGVSGTVQSAALSLYANALFGGSRVLNIYELRPPVFVLGAGNHTPVLGLAAEVGENNLAAADGTPLHPDVYCAGHFEGTTFPTSGSAIAPRIKWGTISRTNAVEIVPDPQAPGTSYWRGTAVNVVPGSTGRSLFKRFYDFTPAVTSDPLYPIDVSKKVEEVFVRAYFMFEDDWTDTTEGIKCGLGISLQFGYWVPNPDREWGGYWQPYGGNSNSYGDGMKHLGDCHDVSSALGPSPYPGDSYYFHADRTQYFYKGCMQFNLGGLNGQPTDPHFDIRPFSGYNYNIDATNVFGQGQSVLANVVNTRFKLGRWYCWEQYIKLNSVDKSRPIYGPKDGSFYDNYEANADGIHRTWINGVLVDEKTNFRWRRNEDMGIDGAGVEWYTGGNGTTNWPYPAHFRVNHVVVAKRYIGPRVKA